ncbi:hypothetical protein [Kushneria konosiri]|uniref:Uncharacterized protein n=1 Tax=Kushneria konosiri TaxID=698828 RepID=A0A2Z2H8B8_9GAMM|nr:hypothetical protein [Kushneria konosiri]ARS53655.1 hypothetical protein B9G99_12960 [Kushneria konosiri]
MSDPRPGRRFDVQGDATTTKTSEASAFEQHFVPVDPAPGARYQLDSVHHPLEDEAPPSRSIAPLTMRWRNPKSVAGGF